VAASIIPAYEARYLTLLRSPFESHTILLAAHISTSFPDETPTNHLQQFLISTLTSSYLVFRNLTSSVSHPYTPAITLVNIAALAAAGIHAGNFWNHKAKIPLPGVGDYNDAITLTERQVMNLRVVVVGWVGSFVLGMFV
jgi:hypothetical protein